MHLRREVGDAQISVAQWEGFDFSRRPGTGGHHAAQGVGTVTWLYVPRPSYQSAPEPEDLTSGLNWRAQMLASCVTWNGKHSRSPTWLRRWKRVSWTKPLFGMISEPSMAARGVERWIGLLAESPANPTASRVNGKAPMTNATSGPTPPELSGQPDPASSFWRTFQVSQGITTSASGQSYEEWVTQLRKDYSRRMKSGHRMSGSGSLSWATPSANASVSQAGTWEGSYYRRADGHKMQTVLTHQVTMWPTPTGSHGRDRYGQRNGADGLPSLKLDGAAQKFPTPTANAQKGFTTTDGKGGASDYKAYSHLARMTPKDGHECSPKCRRLNPLFVERLMGWPGGWTLLPLGLTDLEFSVMEWSRWWRLMRSALLRLE